MRSSLLERASLAESIERLLAGWQTIWCARQTPGRQHSQRAATHLAQTPAHQNPIMLAVMRLSATPSVPDDGKLTAAGTLSRQPLAFRLIGLVFFTETWDKNDHGQAEARPGIDTRQGH